jgi:hypothetical protein
LTNYVLNYKELARVSCAWTDVPARDAKDGLAYSDAVFCRSTTAIANTFFGIALY